MRDRLFMWRRRTGMRVITWVHRLAVFVAKAGGFNGVILKHNEGTSGLVGVRTVDR